MRKLICILTVTALLLSTSVSSFAAAVPNSACGNDTASETTVTQTNRFDLKSFMNELMELFSRLFGQAKETAQPAAAISQTAKNLTAVKSSENSIKTETQATATAKTSNVSADTSKNTNSCPIGNSCFNAGKSCFNIGNNRFNIGKTCSDKTTCGNAVCSSCGNGTCTNQSCDKIACSGSGTCAKQSCDKTACSGSGTCGSNNNCTKNTAPVKAGTSQKPSAPAKTETPVKAPVKTPVKNESAAGKDTEKSPAAPASANLTFEQKVVALVNEQRAANGLNPLTLNEKLSDVARAKSQDMHDKKYFSHTSPTYGSPFDMMKTFGISYRAAGENIAMGYATPETVVDGWMNSPGHRANILSTSFTQIGVGYVSSGNYWTQMFIG